MVNEGESNYEVLGVEPTATKDEIREAYREHLTEAQAAVANAETAKRPSESAVAAARAEEARVRTAWQVLSDPMQRERHDDAYGYTDDVVADGEIVDEDGDDDEPAPRRSRPSPNSRATGRPPGMFSTEIPPTPASWPSGFRPPPPRARFIAFTIDALVLAMLLFLFQVLLGPMLVDQAYPTESKRLDVLSREIDSANKHKDAADSRADAAGARAARAKKNGDDVARQTALDAQKKAKASAKSLQKEIDKKEKEQTKLGSQMLPVTIGWSLAFFALALLYLVPSSVRSGRTLGKRLLEVRVLNFDGTPLNLQGALRRYGGPLAIGMFLSGLVGPLGYMFVLIGLLTWPRNPNCQGFQDRFAKTIVVDG